MDPDKNSPAPAAGGNFIRDMVAREVAEGKHGGAVVTRFPPEPNGYLHIGHAKAICLDFGIAAEFNGRCHLRMDDTNPAKEDQEYADSIKEDIRWLGWDWGENFFYASDYFDRMYECAVELIRRGRAYVCGLTAEEWEACRGDLRHPGAEPPGRRQSVEENLELFERMRRGEFADGEKVLRARIDMASPNIHMRDPVIYRIRHTDHFRSGGKWCIYPMYDFAHPIEDAIEGVTHSFCTLEFEIHRPLYDWVLEALEWQDPPVQTEFARLNLSYTVMSKRKLLQLVKEHHVSGWDDPRMPTICGLRRRGYTPASIRKFCEIVGVTKFNGVTDPALLEFCIREELNAAAPRFMAVLDPLKVVIDNFPEGGTEWLEAVNNPEDPAAGSRRIAFGRELWIEKSDFMEEPVKGYHRLFLGSEVRLRYGYFIRCTGFEKDASGAVTVLHCTYDPETRGGNAPDGRKVKGTIHWVAAANARPAEVRLYDRLFAVPEPGTGEADFLTELNPDSLKIRRAFAEPAVFEQAPGTRMQFERSGYFIADRDGTPELPVFNRIVPLKDSWAKMKK